jgi:GNAT superfamily N-acetyltransferase
MDERAPAPRDESGGAGAVEIRRIPPAEVMSVRDVMCDAFADYPVMLFVLGGRSADYERRLRRLIELFVMARALRGEPLIGAARAEEVQGAVTVSFPGVRESPPAFGVLREGVWADLGADARARYDACGVAWGPLDVDVPHIHVNMLGVRRAHRGTGLARRLLDAVQELSRATPGMEGVTLTTEDAGNLTFYRHVGYEVVGHARISSELESWGLFRRNEREAAPGRGAEPR